MKAVRAVPIQPVAQVADSKDGHKLVLEPSGLQPIHIYRKVSTVLGYVKTNLCDLLLSQMYVV